MREIASLRVALGEVATRDYIRSELRDLLDDLDERESKPRKKKKHKGHDDHGDLHDDLALDAVDDHLDGEPVPVSE